MPLDLNCNTGSYLGLQPAVRPADFGRVSLHNHLSKFLKMSLFLRASTHAHSHTLLILFLWRTLTNTLLESDQQTCRRFVRNAESQTLPQAIVQNLHLNRIPRCFMHTVKLKKSYPGWSEIQDVFFSFSFSFYVCKCISARLVSVFGAFEGPFISG